MELSLEGRTKMLHGVYSDMHIGLDEASAEWIISNHFDEHRNGNYSCIRAL
jgi:hypothetical protein